MIFKVNVEQKNIVSSGKPKLLSEIYNNLYICKNTLIYSHYANMRAGIKSPSNE